MKLLMHTCCAPCSVYCIDSLRAEKIEPTLFWYNPNIHPYTEYKARRDCLKDYAEKTKVELIIDEEYGLDEFCRSVVNDIPNRCVNYCYKKRLTETVRYAAKHGYDTFTTTLLVSPYQKHEEIIKVCEELSSLSGVEFLYRDFRVGFREGQQKAREAGLYMQKYCGCIFSEEDRYKKQIAKESANCQISKNSI
ncbi:epoxyqueuosine reductase QueH [Candidatus Saccharibacteria bacterium]|nr:epoxyqueuosine reductase QueH [Candidatus Saccharibacteria bacterium]